MASETRTWRAGDVSLPVLEGGQWSLQDARGDVVLFFFKTECPTCRLEAPYVERLHRALGGEGVQVVGIAQDEAATVRPWARERGLSFPVLLESPPYPFSLAFDLQAVPHVVWLTPAGQERAAVTGFSRRDLQRLADGLARTVARPGAGLFAAGDPAPDWQPG